MNGVAGEKPSFWFRRPCEMGMPFVWTGSSPGAIATRKPVVAVGSGRSKKLEGKGVRQSSPMSGLHPGAVAGGAPESSATGGAASASFVFPASLTFTTAASLPPGEEAPLVPQPTTSKPTAKSPAHEAARFMRRTVPWCARNT